MTISAGTGERGVGEAITCSKGTMGQQRSWGLGYVTEIRKSTACPIDVSQLVTLKYTNKIESDATHPHEFCLRRHFALSVNVS